MEGEDTKNVTDQFTVEDKEDTQSAEPDKIEETNDAVPMETDQEEPMETNYEGKSKIEEEIPNDEIDANKSDQSKEIKNDEVKKELVENTKGDVLQEKQETMSVDEIRSALEDHPVKIDETSNKVCTKSIEQVDKPAESPIKEIIDANVIAIDQLNASDENNKIKEDINAINVTNEENNKLNEPLKENDENKLTDDKDVDMDLDKNASNDNLEEVDKNITNNFDNSETTNVNKDLPSLDAKIAHFKSDHDNYKQDISNNEPVVNPSNLNETTKDEIENALSALASAAIDHAKDTDVKSQVAEPKDKEVWHTVGFIKGTSLNVQNYFYLEDVNQNLTEDQLPDVSLLNRINLEPGTAYKFRVAAINSVGRSDWSEVSAFKTCVPGFPSAPSAIRIAKSVDGAHISWEPPKGEITEYSVYLAVQNNAKENVTPSTMAFVRVYCGAKNSCVVLHSSLSSAYVDTTTKSAIIFRIAARNEKGYGPATQVRWLQDSANRAVKRPTEDGQAAPKKTKND